MFTSDKTNNNTQKQVADTSKVITFNLDFWNYICPRQSAGKRYSRITAFYDLLHRAELARATGNNSYLEVSLQELSVRWCWQRSTVKKYLLELQGFGILSLDKAMPNGKTVLTFI